MPPAKPRYVDTNIFLRFLTCDLAEPAARCAELIRRLRDREEVAQTTPLVVAEVVWTLERFYRLPKVDVARKVAPLLRLRGLRVVDKEVLLRALDLYADRRVSFTDACLAADMERSGCAEIYSYDRDFERLQEVKRIEP